VAYDKLTRAELTKLRAAGKEHAEQLLIRAAADERIRAAGETIASAVRALARAVPVAELAKAARLSVEEIEALTVQERAERAEPVTLDQRTMAAAGDLTTLAGVTTAIPLTQKFGYRRTLFVHLGRGHFYDPGTGRAWSRGEQTPLPVLLADMLALGARRAYLCDGPDWCMQPGDRGRMGAVLRWVGQEVPEWVAGRHYVAESDTPTARWTHTGTGLEVEIHRAGAWYGPADEYDPRTAGQAWALLESLVADKFADERRGPGMLFSTPGTTGKSLWRHTLGRREYPILSPDLRQLIKSTSGQGRQELLPPLGAGDELGDVAQYDGRLMYAALTAAMPSGPPTLCTGEPVDAPRVLAGPGRWRITATVPAGWDHVGLLPSPVAGTRGAWQYPASPGEQFDTWVSGREVSLARSLGWHLVIHEGFSFPSGKVLDPWMTRWKSTLARLGEMVSTEQTTPAVAELAERAIRFVILHSIGGFASAGHRVTRTAPADRPELAGDARPIDGVHREGHLLVWHERGQISPWQEQTAHPEYAAEIWARARVRLLQGPVDYPQMGALSLPRERVIAFDLDALYLSGRADWKDDGKPGRLRLKATSVGPHEYPRSLQELRDLMKGREI